MLLLWEALGHTTGREEDFAVGIPQPMLEAEPAMTAAFQNTVSSLRKAGVTVQPVDISAMLAKLFDAQRIIAFYEGARFHQQRFNKYGDRLGYLAGLVHEGLQIPDTRYEDAKRFVDESRVPMTEMDKATPVILVPAATGPAPSGITSTGDARNELPVDRWELLRSLFPCRSAMACR